MNLIENQINYGLIKEENFKINLCINGQTIMIFYFTSHIETLKTKIYNKKKKINYSQSYLSCLNKLVDQYKKKNYNHSFYKRLINVDFSALTEKIETNLIRDKFKLVLHL